MKKTFAVLILSAVMVLSVLVFAQEAPSVVKDGAAPEAAAPTPDVAAAPAELSAGDNSAVDPSTPPTQGVLGDDMVGNDIINDEGYGNDEEYFGAEVNGVEDGYLDDGPVMGDNAAMPDADAPMPDANMPAPDVNGAMPDANMPTPDLNAAMPDAAAQ